MTTHVGLLGLGGGDRHWGPWYTGAPVQPLGQVGHPTVPAHPSPRLLACYVCQPVQGTLSPYLMSRLCQGWTCLYTTE